MAEVKAEDAGPFGTLMPPFQGDPFATVVKEMRDRGMAWKDYMPTACAAAASWCSGPRSKPAIICISCPIHFTTTARSRFAWARPARTCPGRAHRGPRAQRPLANRPRPGRRQQELGHADAARREPRRLERRGPERAVQRRARGRRRLGRRGIHDDPGRDPRSRTPAARRSPTT